MPKTALPAHPRRDSESLYLDVRGLRHHVRAWGAREAPRLFMLHGWMDVSASFQFLVEALRGRWRVLAPDWRGFGLTAWAREGYWFHDYLADLDALLDALSPGEPARLVGHSLGGNVAGLYAGARPDRVARLVSLEGFGTPRTRVEDVPQRLAKWLTALRHGASLSTYRTRAAVADRLQKNNPRLPRERAEFLAEHWSVEDGAGGYRIAADPRHKLPFPTAASLEDWLACWRQVTAPVLWVAAADSHIRGWLARGGEDWALRVGAFRDLSYALVPEAGHMLHHDQPARVAALVEEFMT